MMGKNTKFIFVKRHLVKKIVSVKNVCKKLLPWMSDIILNVFHYAMEGFERKSSLKCNKKIILLCHSKCEKKFEYIQGNKSLMRWLYFPKMRYQLSEWSLSILFHGAYLFYL